MPDGEELEQRLYEFIEEQERRTNAILSIEIESLKKAVEKVENVSGIRRSKD